MRCPACDTPNAPEARFCSQCGAKMPQAKARPEIEVVDDVERRPRRAAGDEYERRPRPGYADEDLAEDEPGAVASIIPYRNGKALASYYLGMLCVVTIGAIIVVTAIALVKKEPPVLAFFGPIA